MNPSLQLYSKGQLHLSEGSSCSKYKKSDQQHQAAAATQQCICQPGESQITQSPLVGRAPCQDQGANRSARQPAPSRVYRNRSCILFGLPCQNSMLLGTTLKPPQNDGRLRSLLANFCFISSSLASRRLRDEITELCCETQAPS